MSYTKIPRSEIELRLNHLKTRLREEKVEGAILFSIPEIYYYSGFGADGVVYVPVEGMPIHLVKRNIPLANHYSRIQNVQNFGKLPEIFDTLGIKTSSRILLEKKVLPASFVDFLQLKKKNIELIDGSSIFRQIRSIKSSYEIKMIEKAAKLVDQSFEYCTEIVSPDMTEIALSTRLDGWLLNNGHNGYITTRSFNSALLHYSYVISSNSSTMNINFTPISGGGLSLKYPFGPSRRKLGKKPFFVDTCGNNQGYISDTTRTFIIGKFDPETKFQLESLSSIKEFLHKKLKPNINLGELYNNVMELSKELEIYDHFMGTESDKSAFLGHGVGLELDDLPVFYEKGGDLKVGNVIACEPKFFVENHKVLGIEDTFAINETRNVLLSKAPDYFEI